jgi:ribonuclease VapC
VVIDTSAILAVLFGEGDGERFGRAMLAAPELCIAAPTWLESAMVITTRKGYAGFTAFAELLDGLCVETIPFDENQARIAYEAWIRFGKGRHPAALNMGDCHSYALAKSRSDVLLFKGDDFTQTDILRFEVI